MARISSLLQKPASGQMPARLREPMRKVAKVQGMALRRPPISRISKVPVAWLTLPEPRKSSALKKAWVNRWKMPTAVAALAISSRRDALMRQRQARRAQTQHHVAELADGGVGQHALDIVHDQAHGGGEDGGKAADDGDDREGLLPS